MLFYSEDMLSFSGNEVFEIYDSLKLIGISTRFMYLKNNFRFYEKKTFLKGQTIIKYQLLYNRKFSSPEVYVWIKKDLRFHIHKMEQKYFFNYHFRRILIIMSP